MMTFTVIVTGLVILWFGGVIGYLIGINRPKDAHAYPQFYSSGKGLKNLVLAAREVAYGDPPIREELKALDEALEEFADKFPWREEDEKSQRVEKDPRKNWHEFMSFDDEVDKTLDELEAKGAKPQVRPGKELKPTPRLGEPKRTITVQQIIRDNPGIKLAGILDKVSPPQTESEVRRQLQLFRESGFIVHTSGPNGRGWYEEPNRSPATPSAMVLQAVKDNPGAKLSQLTDWLLFSREYVVAMLQLLKREGEIEYRTGSGGWGWYVKE